MAQKAIISKLTSTTKAPTHIASYIWPQLCPVNFNMLNIHKPIHVYACVYVPNVGQIYEVILQPKDDLSLKSHLQINSSAHTVPQQRRQPYNATQQDVSSHTYIDILTTDLMLGYK